jgi:hypothetical protein
VPLSKFGVLGNASIGATYGAIVAPTSGLIVEGNVGIGITNPGGKLDVESTQTTGTVSLIGAPSATVLSAALTGQSINLQTNYTATGYNVTGQTISLPSVTNTGAGTYAYKGLTIGGGALIQNTGAGVDTWSGMEITMPNITQTTGTVTSTGLKITGGTVTSGTSYALLTDANAGNIGLGIAAPTYYLDVASATNTNLFRLGYAGSDIVTVTNAQTTFNNPVNMAAAGDVSIAYDLLMTNATAGNIVFQGPGYVKTDSPFQNLDLTLSAANGGFVIVDDTLQAIHTDTGTTAGNYYGVQSDFTNSGIFASAGSTMNVMGVYGRGQATGISTNGTVNSYGGYFEAVGENTGAATSVGYGLYVNGSTGADTNYSAAFMNGNVGIGVTNPNARLSLGQWTTNSESLLVYDNGVANNVFNSGFGNISGDLTMFSSSGKGIRLVTGGGRSGANTVIVDSNGNVGIGTTVPLSKLGVLGNASIGATYGAIVAPTSGLIVEGSVGIGVTNPTDKLNVSGGNIILDSTYYVGYNQYSNLLFTNSGGDSVLNASGNMRINIDSNNNETATYFDIANNTNSNSGGNILVRFQENGNVGIGITNPANKLSIGASSATVLAAALTGQSIDLQTNYTATGYNVTGQTISLPSVTNTGAGTYAYKGLTIGGGALIQNTGAGTDTWSGMEITMPNITQTTGTVTSTGLKITGGTVTSGTSYALLTDANAGNIGLGIATPTYYLDVASATNTNLFRLGYAGSDIVTVTNAQTTFNNPVNMAAAGDVSIANDLIMTNTTVGDIKFKGPGYVMTDSSWRNLDLTLSAANGGFVIVDDTLQAIHTDTGTTAGNYYGVQSDFTNSGIFASAGSTMNVMGVYGRGQATGISTNGTVNSYGGYFEAVGENTGAATSVGYGLYVNGSTGADTNYSAAFMNGNVGIGVTNPADLLEVANAIRLTGTGSFVSSQSRLYNTASGLQITGSGGVNIAIGGGGQGIMIDNSANTKIGNGALYVQYNGNVGIGTTVPLSKLGVLGSASIGATYGAIVAPTSGLIVESKIGIGTTAPATMMEIYGASDALRLSYDGSHYLQLSDDGTNGIITTNTGSLNLGTSGDLTLSNGVNIVTEGTLKIKGDSSTRTITIGDTVKANDDVVTIDASNWSVQTSGMVNASIDGLGSKVVAGAVADASFTGTPFNGLMAMDSSDARLYIRYGGAWHYFGGATGFQIPSYEVAPYSQLSAENKVLSDNLLPWERNNYPQYITDKIQPGELLIPYSGSDMSDGAVHGLYARFSDVKGIMFADENEKINQINAQLSLISQQTLGIDQNATTLEGLKESINEQLALISNSQAQMSNELINIDSQLSTLNSQLGVVATLQSQMDDIKKQTDANTSLLLAMDPENMIYKDALGNVDLMKGKLTAEGVVAGAFTVKVVDPNAKTIGEAVITAVAKDDNVDGIDDITGSDGKGIEIKTTAVTVKSKIYMTPVGSTKNQTIYVKEVKPGESFAAGVDNPVSEDIKFNWWIVEEQ